MKTHYPIGIIMAILLIMTADLSQATTSVVQLKVESNTRCESLSTHSIREARDTTYSVGGDGFDQATGSSDGQVFKYKLSNINSIINNRIEWKVITPDPNNTPTTAKRVNFIILKLAGNNGSNAAYYVQPGEYQDTGVSTQASIVGVSFCYGLSQPFSAKLESCDISECSLPQGVQARIITKFDEPADDSNWQVKTCACAPQPGQQQFTECDPNIPPGTPGACTKTPTPENPDADGTLLFLPMEVQLGRNRDSYYCLVLNGTRKCYAK